MVRKFTRAEGTAWDSPPENDSRRPARSPYARRETAFPSILNGVYSKAPEEYQASLDVITITGHSRREVQPRSRWLMFADIALSSAVREQRWRKARITSPAFDKLWTRLNDRRIELLQIDLELGLTMAQIAASAGSDTEKRERNTRNARKAYNTVLRFRDTIAPTREQSRYLTERFRELYLSLVNLGEPLQFVPMPA